MAGVIGIFLLLSDHLPLFAFAGAMLGWSALFLLGLWPRLDREELRTPTNIWRL